MRHRGRFIYKYSIHGQTVQCSVEREEKTLVHYGSKFQSLQKMFAKRQARRLPGQTRLHRLSVGHRAGRRGGPDQSGLRGQRQEGVVSVAVQLPVRPRRRRGDGPQLPKRSLFIIRADLPAN